jgi:adenosine/AMP kinase
VPVIVRLVVRHGNSHYILLIDVIQMLMCFNDCGSASMRHEVALVNAGCSKIVKTSGNEDAIIAAVEQEL